MHGEAQGIFAGEREAIGRRRERAGARRGVLGREELLERGIVGIVGRGDHRLPRVSSCTTNQSPTSTSTPRSTSARRGSSVMGRTARRARAGEGEGDPPAARGALEAYRAASFPRNDVTVTSAPAWSCAASIKTLALFWPLKTGISGTL